MDADETLTQAGTDIAGDQAAAGGPDDEPERDAGTAEEQTDGSGAEDGEDGEPGEPDPVAAWRESDEGKAFLRQVANRELKQIRRDIERALTGDDKARAALESNANGRRILAAAERRAGEQAQALTTERSIWQQWNDLDVFERDAHFREHPEWGQWFHANAPVYSTTAAQTARPSSAGTGTGTDPLAEAVADMQADERWALLTDDERDALDPDEFEGLPPVKAAAKLGREAEKLFARAEARHKTAPARERAEKVNAVAAGVRAGIAAGPPLVAGGSSARMTEAQIEQAYIDNPTPATRAAYAALRQRRNW